MPVRSRSFASTMKLILSIIILKHSSLLSGALVNHTANFYGSRQMRREARSMAVGWNSASPDIVLLVGGRGESISTQSQSISTFTVSTRSFTNGAQQHLTWAQNTYLYAQGYADTGAGSLWTISGTDNLVRIDTASPYAAETEVAIPNGFNWMTTFSCLVHVDNVLFVLGGMDSNVGVTEGGIYYGKMYNIGTGVWSDTPLFNNYRSRSACIATPNDELYVIAGGGIDMHSIPKKEINYLKSAEKIDVSDVNAMASQQWKVISGELTSARAGVRAVIYADEIIVLGGFDGVSERSDLQCINWQTDAARMCGTMQVALVDVTPIIVGKTVHIFGGSTGTHTNGWLYTKYYQYIDLPDTGAPTSVTTAPSRQPSSVTSHPSSSPTPAPSAATGSPSLSPSSHPTSVTDEPSVSPTKYPTIPPSNEPSATPSTSPSDNPTEIPSSSPTRTPSLDPTRTPSSSPTMGTGAPSETPSSAPTNAPSSPPTGAPSSTPSNAPSFAPTGAPSSAPTNPPSSAPTNAPSFTPSSAPTHVPSSVPSDTPSLSPTIAQRTTNDGDDDTHNDNETQVGGILDDDTAIMILGIVLWILLFLVLYLVRRNRKKKNNTIDTEMLEQHVEQPAEVVKVDGADIVVELGPGRDGDVIVKADPDDENKEEEESEGVEVTGVVGVAGVELTRKPTHDDDVAAVQETTDGYEATTVEMRDV